MNRDAAVLTSRYKKIAGVSISVVALLSTTLSVLRLIYFGIDDRTRIASASYFKQTVYDIYRNTRFLDWFWDHCPRPNLGSYKDLDNVYFLLIYYLVFVGLALYSSGQEIAKELARTHSLETAPSEIPDNSLFSQFHQLFLVPIAVTFIGAVALKYLGLI